ncbi:sugar phosphate isomerase/epimerase family protein [Actinophytocola oryzae]|uniref:Sugar phosphate isomerase/epimerase n=1 Tax=Actinophytocola oryzae TaxID=502181 RepID=A0A4V3FTQ6_9PSEU|nr:sugar phosphate isomerase/epimerase [Actinophytocola oryzae]TDV52301.1 sugar phosphate isomerase/epimerase [Actinophytocola oryzae]
MDNGVTRRRVLTLLGAGAATLGMAAGVAQADVDTAGRCRRIPRSGIGMHLYTVRDILNADPLGTLTALADIGYRCVGVSSFNRPAAEIRDLCAETRLNPVILHVGHGDITGNWAAKLAEARTIGVRWVVLSSFPNEMYTVEGMRLGVRQLNEAGAAARELGMGMLHHNHDSEFSVVDGIRLSDILFGESDPRLVGFELDLGWATRAGMDGRRLFVENPGRFPVLHVKDHDGQGAWTDVGSGVVDWARIFEKYDRAGVRYWLVERDDQPAPLDTSRNSFDYLAALRF